MIERSPFGPGRDEEWDAFVAAHPAGHLLQASGWGALRASRGWSVRRVTVGDREGAPAAGAQVLVRRTLGGPVGYVPRGPVCRPGDEALPALIRAMRRAVGPGALLLRLEPHWADEPEARRRLSALGLEESEATQPPSTVRVRLADEDRMLSAMHQKWRYNVRLAARSGVDVVEGGERDLDVFEALLAHTARRDGFPARTRGYYADAWRHIGPGRAHLYLARHEGRVLAAILVAHFADTATYLYGASSDLERQRMPNHLVQWEAMRRARADGRTWYDLWGIPDEIGRAVAAGRAAADVEQGRGGLWGVWGFKRGFGGEVWRTVGAWDDGSGRIRRRLAAAVLERLARLRR